MNGEVIFWEKARRGASGKRVGLNNSNKLTGNGCITSVSSVVKPYEILAGTGVAEWCRFGHDAEMEWCLIFSRPLSRLQIDEKLQCFLQGAIRERQMDPARGEGGAGDGNPSGRTIIAMNGGVQGGSFGGLRTSLGELLGGMIFCRMRLQYLKENLKERVDRTLSSSILADLPLIESLKQLQQESIKKKYADTNIIRLHPPGNSGGYLKERWLKYHSAFTAVKATGGKDLLNSKIRHQLVTDVIRRREYIKSGTTARLDVFDSQGANIGTSFLEVR